MWKTIGAFLLGALGVAVSILTAINLTIDITERRVVREIAADLSIAGFRLDRSRLDDLGDDPVSTLRNAITPIEKPQHHEQQITTSAIELGKNFLMEVGKVYELPPERIPTMVTGIRSNAVFIVIRGSGNDYRLTSPIKLRDSQGKCVIIPLSTSSKTSKGWENTGKATMRIDCAR
ncbi:MAG: hypothetical protein AAFR53_14885 [Pseudomonadota bacterium]